MGDTKKDEERKVSLKPQAKAAAAPQKLKSRKGTRGRSSSNETVPLDEEPPPMNEQKPRT